MLVLRVALFHIGTWLPSFNAITSLILELDPYSWPQVAYFLRIDDDRRQLLKHILEMSKRGSPLMGYFVHGRDGTGAWQMPRVVCVSARAFFVDSSDFVVLFRHWYIFVVR